MSTRNPAWTEDEVVLAVELYFRIDPSDIKPSGAEIIELSSLLRSLPGNEKWLQRNPTFRNADGVSMKMANFKSFDDRYEGKGLDRGSKLDKEVLRRYAGDQAALKRRAAQLRSIVAHQDGIPSLVTVHDDEVPDEVTEGKTVFKLHRTRERDTRIARRKKKDVLKKTGRLECEACGFDFQATYGELGEGFCEVHHRTPLAELDGETKTTLKGLAVVCANCHRMLHRMTDMSVQGLKDLLTEV